MPGKRPPPAFIVADLPAMRAVFAASEASGRKLRAESPPGFAGFAGAGFWQAALAEAAAAHPAARVEAVLDCGEEAGLALAAIRAGVPAIRLRARTAARARLKDIARKAGVKFVEGRRPAACDLTVARDAARAATDYLSRSKGKATRPRRTGAR